MDAEIARGAGPSFQSHRTSEGALPFSRFVREGGDFDFPSPLSWTGRGARAFDLAETARSVSAPLLRFFCKAGDDAADIMRFSSPPSLRLLK